MNTTSNLSELMQSYYDADFLKRSNQRLVMDQFGQKRPIPKGEGKTITFSRWANLAKASTALTEGTNPAGSNLSAENVTGQIAQYGDFVKISKLVSLTALDVGITEKIPILAEQAAQTIDEKTMTEVAENGTAQVVSTAANLAAILATDILTGKDIRIAVRDQKKAIAMPFENGFYPAIVAPDTTYDFQDDATWVDAAKYSAITKLYKGEIGKWFGCRFIETTVPYRSDTDGTKNYETGAVFYTLVLGREAYGITELDGLRKMMYVFTQGSTENPLAMYSTAGWKASHVAIMLKSAWTRVIQSGATA